MLANEMNALSRRAFLSATGALVVALATPAELAEAAAAATNGLATRPPVTPGTLSSYISIEPDGTVVAYYGKIDGGQGLETSVAQLVAEEIDVPWERVRVVMGDTALTVNMGGATAGNGMRQAGPIMRQTAAEARRLLIEMASKALGVPAADLTVTDGVVHSVADPSQAHLLCPAYRRPPFRRAGPMERQGAAARRQGSGAAEEAVRVQGHRQADAAPRHAGQGVRHAATGQRRAAAQHAACAHDPPDRCRARCRSRSMKSRSPIFPAPRWSGSRTSSPWSRRRNGTRSRPRRR